MGNIFEKIELGEIAHIFAGYAFRGAIIGDPLADTTVVRMSDIDVLGNMNWQNTLQVSLQKVERYHLHDRDILVVARGSKNKAIYLNEIPKQSICAAHFFFIRIKEMYKERIDPEFINWQLNQDNAQSHLSDHAVGVNQRVIRKNILETTPIKIFDYKTQISISQLYRIHQQELKILNDLTDNTRKRIASVAEQILG